MRPCFACVIKQICVSASQKEERVLCCNIAIDARLRDSTRITRIASKCGASLSLLIYSVYVSSTQKQRHLSFIIYELAMLESQNFHPREPAFPTRSIQRNPNMKRKHIFMNIIIPSRLKRTIWIYATELFPEVLPGSASNIHLDMY